MPKKEGNMDEISEAIEMFKKETGYDYGEENNRKVKTALSALCTIEWIGQGSKNVDCEECRWAILEKFREYQKG